MLTVIQSANLAAAFLLELCALAALGYWGFQTGESTLVKIILGIGAPLLLIVVWGKFLAPKSSTRLRDPALTLVKLLILGVAAAALASAGQPGLALIFALAVVINLALAYIWKQH